MYVRSRRTAIQYAVSDMNGCKELSDRRHALRPVDNKEPGVMESNAAVASIASTPRGYRRRTVSIERDKILASPISLINILRFATK